MSGNILENRINNLEHRIESPERQQTEIKQFERTLLKRDFLMTTVQIIAMVLAISGAGGFLAYQNSLLIGQIDKRMEETHRRMEQMEKRFEDLKQVVLADRQRRENK